MAQGGKWRVLITVGAYIDHQHSRPPLTLANLGICKRPLSHDRGGRFHTKPSESGCHHRLRSYQDSRSSPESTKRPSRLRAGIIRILTKPHHSELAAEILHPPSITACKVSRRDMNQHPSTKTKMASPTFRLMDLPPELRILIYDHAFPDDGNTMFQQTPPIAGASQEARTHYYNTTNFRLGTVAASLTNKALLRSTFIHPDSRRFLLYLGDEGVRQIKRLTVTRAARHYARRKDGPHNVRAYAVRFQEGLKNFSTRQLGEFERTAVVDTSALTKPATKPMTCWHEAPRIEVVLRRLVNAGETELTVQNLMCLMAMMCGLRDTDEDRGEDGRDAVRLVETFLAGWKSDSWAAGCHWPATL